MFTKPKPRVSSLQEPPNCKKGMKRVEHKGRKDKDDQENQERNFNIKRHFKIKAL